MGSWQFLRNVILKALGLFVVINLAFTAWDPSAALGHVSAYNLLFPGRQRFPFGENPQKSYNLSLYNLDAMFASHEINAGNKPADEFRVILIGDSAAWGTLLAPSQTLAGQLNSAGLAACDGRRVRVYNLGYPTLSLTKDIMLLEEAMRYQPDLVLWPVTLESFVRQNQLSSPLVANNAQRVRALIAAYGLNLDPNSPDFARPDFWARTLVGQRRPLADLLRLQLYGVMWAATGIDQEYPQNYPPAQRDLEAKVDYYGWQPPAIPAGGLALDVLSAGLRIAGNIPVLIFNEPVLVSQGKNSETRYNYYYPRWVYDAYRQTMQEQSQQAGWGYLDLWNLVPQDQFTNSAIHLTPAGTAILVQRVGNAVLKVACP